MPTGQARSGAIDHTLTDEYTSEELWSERDALRNLWKNQQEEDNTTGIRPVVM